MRRFVVGLARDPGHGALNARVHADTRPLPGVQALDEPGEQLATDLDAGSNACRRLLRIPRQHHALLAMDRRKDRSVLDKREEHAVPEVVPSMR